MKVLLVKSGDDYGALLFEQNSDLTVQEAFDKAKDNGGRYEDLIQETFEGTVLNSGVAIYKSFEFDEDVSDEFLMFIRNHIQDDSKHTNFYVMK